MQFEEKAAEELSHLPLPEPIAEMIIHTPDNPPWGSGVAVAVWVLSVLSIFVFPALLLFPYLAAYGLSDGAEMVEFAKTDPTAVLLQVIGVLPAHIFTLFLAWLVVTRNRTLPFRKNLGWHAGGTRWWHYCIILGAFFVVASIVLHFFPETEHEVNRILRSSRAAVVVVAILAVATAPIVEEVVYRGILYSAFQRTFGVPLAVTAVSLMFAGIHLPQYYPSVGPIFLITLLSFTLTMLRVRTGSLLPCIILHALFNGIQAVLLIAEPWLPTAEKTSEAAIFLTR
jgi:uncharacterized protein